MSDYSAIATATAVIREILRESQSVLDGGSVDVSTSTPATVLKNLTKDNDILNLFLYQVTPNIAYRNADLPTIHQNGNRMLSKPLLALDLHYLLSAASTHELKAQLMLSSAMIALHENAIIPKRKIKETIDTIAQLKPEGEEFIAASNLASQTESLKISLESLSIEELTKLWSTFAQTEYHLSAAYHVSVLLLESTKKPETSKQVDKRILHINPLQQKPPTKK
ncbi:DUF4255 domain-containing protein [Candidatus Bathycorpusculum sp.]|uniref:DUF4255 domain-containing protein n=1 Tax=Candidatus Bathycorpusculum sp. TaxID=2994959 RepID=UPI00282D25E8|nr:DUF4255 domain-containing protein [Candidatus Termitimicrobium sp.]MCL2686619.1 DUF4255 domain-containing protein [Candidatus Termitimicrobium sp.]